MERNAKIGVGLVVLGALGVGVYMQYKKDQSLGKESSTADLPDMKGTDDVDKIDIVNGSKGEVVLEKKGDKWEVTKPVNATANQQNVKSLLDNMKDLKIVDRAAPKVDDELKKTYELTPDKAVHITTSKGGEKKIEATFGKSGGLGDAVILEGKEGIYLAKGYSTWLYAKEVKDWRDREILKLDDANIVGFEIANKNGDFVFAKDTDWKGTVKGKPIANFDANKVPTAVGAFKNLTADDFADGKSASETGVDAPEATVTIKQKDGGTHIVRVGKAVDKAHYAQKDGEGLIYTIGTLPSEWATCELAKFQQATDGGAPAAGGKDAGKK